MFDHGAYPRLEPGHAIHMADCDIVKDFPHVCPGAGCAIQRFLEQQVQRETYRALETA